MVFLSKRTCKTWLALIVVFASVFVTPSYAKESGTWKDPRTGLTWQRCSLGQTWNGYDCDGEPKWYTWDKAQQVVNAIGKGWRIPAVSELVSLVRCNTGFREVLSLPDRKGKNKTMPSICNEGASRPTIDITIFPNTPDKIYWTSSPYAGRYDDAVWFVTFYNGNTDYSLTGESTSCLRLVRSGQ